MECIYVINQDGKPLMPTKRLGMVSRWLKSGQAHWYKNRRDTIQFDRKTTDYIQEVVQGCDLGDHLGMSVITNNQEVYASESYCNGKQTHKLMQKRKEMRRTRRNRLRHRKPRFDNRKKKGYAPSIQRKLDFQIKEIKRIDEFLPITKRVFEGSTFDINELTHHAQWQKGYKTTFDFLYDRDHGCDALDGKHYPKKDMVIHHLVQRHNGGTNNPDNLVLLARKNHTQANHKNGVLDKLAKQRQKKYKNADTRGAYFMNVLGKELPKYFNFVPTYGYITAEKREKYGIAKTHHDDAFVIAGGTNQTKRFDTCFYREKQRRNNRSLEKFYDAQYRDLRTSKKEKGAVLSSGKTHRSLKDPRNNQRVFRANKLKKGRRTIRKQHYQLRPKDLVSYNDKIYRVKGMQNNGTRVLLITSTKDKSVAIKKVKYMFHINGVYQTERITTAFIS